MFIIESKNYKKDYQKKILNKHLKNEMLRIEDIKNLIVASDNLKELINSPYKNIYHIEQKTGNMCELYTARINNKIRLILKPIGEYPYNLVEIIDIEFIEIDDKHYKEG